ncbi:hypothetical protein G8A07_14215 [Roseateles sp. DAIF2]|uniref:hypothetical protein n=1 Tax=Roseateles sp. DAIF2 TaxID=2714952 RepID=UPI0018A338F3|nr:hypothetical protein [Roseateles sp. DAIF2]QPF73960.1 hypothetical protein G8A07_14215 [Roseateles sp. DAIF2]
MRLISSAGNAFVADPFAMLLDPERVSRAVERSERLNRLHSRVYRPLDKPLIPKAIAGTADFDRLVDDAPDSEED